MSDWGVGEWVLFGVFLLLVMSLLTHGVSSVPEPGW
jgi:hypothetical protein